MRVLVPSPDACVSMKVQMTEIDSDEYQMSKIRQKCRPQDRISYCESLKIRNGSHGEAKPCF